MNAGIDNALKMREMFNSNPGNYRMWASFYADANVIEVRLSAYTHTEDKVMQFAQPQSTYRFNNDGSYNKVTHL
jgi:hypothetical protein